MNTPTPLLPQRLLQSLGVAAGLGLLACGVQAADRVANGPLLGVDVSSEPSPAMLAVAAVVALVLMGTRRLNQR